MFPLRKQTIAVQSADLTEPAAGHTASLEPGEAAAESGAGLETGIVCMTACKPGDKARLSTRS